MDIERQDRGVIIQIAKDFKAINLNQSKLEDLVKAVCNRFKLSKATISIAIVDDAGISKVNKQFLGHDCITDCLSFDLSDDNTHKMFELVVNGEKAVREAGLQGHLGEAELALYITHALLHNLGFDDSVPGQAKKMHETENDILEQQGYGLVY